MLDWGQDSFVSWARSPSIKEGQEEVGYQPGQELDVC